LPVAGLPLRCSTTNKRVGSLAGAVTYTGPCTVPFAIVVVATLICA